MVTALQEYNVGKRIEHSYKSIFNNGNSHFRGGPEALLPALPGVHAEGVCLSSS